MKGACETVQLKRLPLGCPAFSPVSNTNTNIKIFCMQTLIFANKKFNYNV